MAQPKLSILLVLMTCSTISFSYPTGAPTSACQTMMPGHAGVSPQTTPAPYMIKINASSYQSGKPIQVQILGPPYKGILLQARTNSKTTLYGTWLQPPSNTKILACPGNTAGSITHSNNNLKDQSTTYLWMPPNSDCPDNLFFIATVVEEFKTYWLGVKSAVITKGSAATCSITKNVGHTSFASSGTAWYPTLYSFICLQIVLILVQGQLCYK